MRLTLYLTFLYSSLTASACVLYSQGKADCSDSRLLHVPSSLPRNLHYLDLSDNSIHISQPLSKKFSRLFSLNLSNNPLNVLPVGTFQNLPDLQSLDLSSCGISRLDPKTFKGLINLKTLILRNNTLSTLFLGNLKALTYLDVRANLLISHPLQHSFSQLLASRGLCDCTSESPPHNADQHVSGIFCSCPIQLNEKGSLGSFMSEVHKRFARDVTETPGNYSSQNLTSPAPSTGGSQGRSWPYLVGFIVAAIGVSLLIALVAKCNVFHRYFRSYRHRPLPENEWMSHSQTELPGVPIPPPEDEDGFIEDNYIQPEDHREEVDEDQGSFYSI